jgi:tetratricopeptide (TPR) repeat protein
MNAEEMLSRAQQSEGQNLWPESTDWYRRVLDISPDHEGAKERLAWCLSRSGEFVEAVVLFEELAGLQTQVAKWPYMVGYQYQQMGKLREAIQWYERALILKGDYVVVLYRKGLAHSQLGEVGTALGAFELCRQAWRSLPEGQPKEKDKGNCAKAAYHQAKVLIDNPTKIDSESGSEAVALLREACELDPRDHNKHYLLGKALLMRGRDLEAVDALRHADSLKPDQDYILDKWATGLAKLGRLDDAVKIYERIPAQRRKAYILRSLGGLLCRLGRHEEAEEILRSAVGKDRRNHNGHYLLAACYRARERWKPAAAEFREAIRLRQVQYGKPFPEAQRELDELLAEHPQSGATTGEDRRPCGTVSKYLDAKGYGFIAADQGGDLFFHISECGGLSGLLPGMRVEFDISEGEKGPRAVRVRVVDDADA